MTDTPADAEVLNEEALRADRADRSRSEHERGDQQGQCTGDGPRRLCLHPFCRLELRLRGLAGRRRRRQHLRGALPEAPFGGISRKRLRPGGRRSAIYDYLNAVRLAAAVEPCVRGRRRGLGRRTRAGRRRAHAHKGLKPRACARLLRPDVGAYGRGTSAPGAYEAEAAYHEAAI